MRVMTWPAGQKLYSDRYVIEKPLGQGGFCITYLARDKKGKQVVIKTLKDEVLSSSDFAKFREKFQRDFRDEALRVALCRHPHIVQIDNAFQEGMMPCIAMEYIEGQDLWKRVNQLGVLSQTEALHYIRQIGDALTVLHEKGLLHRDVKPQNILLRQEKPEAVLIDFGIAREFVPDFTQVHTLALTHGFAPIEQYAEAAHRGEFTDVYALAATLYYLLTNKVPTPAFVRAAKVSLEPPQKINPQISDAVNQAILQGMAFEPDNRPQSVPAWLRLFDFSCVDQEMGTLPIRDWQAGSHSADLRLTPTVVVPRSAEVKILNSGAAVDYAKLRDLLTAGKWKEADLETAVLMLKLSEREEEGWLDYEDIEKFPCQDLHTIDQLWVQSSNGRFGFSVQRRIYEACGKNYVTFGDRVGWRVKGTWLWWNDLTFSAEAFPGHLPGWRIGGSGGVWGCFVTVGGSLLARPDL